ncbi:MAG: PorV/PorQ family protein [candidate division WOR-3 bacterium]|nr:PorV/PorQ family protein [candidate division WOR-3 bacterium]
MTIQRFKDSKIPRLMLCLVICNLLIFSLTAIYADVKFSKVGTTSAQFLKISVGRASGMGDAFVAIADDASATYFNPAGLSQISKREGLFSHINWIADLNHDYISMALPTKLGTIAFSATALTMGDMERLMIDNPKTTVREDTATGLYFSAADLSLAVSYGRQITDKLSFGFSTKAISQSIWNMSATGAAFDFGLFYNTGYRSLRLGAVITNFGTAMSFSGLGLEFQDTTLKTKPRAVYKTTPTTLPTTFRFGIAYNFIETPNDILTMALDLVHPNDINETVNVGLEYAYKKLLFLRTGYILNTDLEYAKALKYSTGLSAGAGVKFDLKSGMNLRLDYCYRDMGWLKGAHRLILGIGF